MIRRLSPSAGRFLNWFEQPAPGGLRWVTCFANNALFAVAAFSACSSEPGVSSLTRMMIERKVDTTGDIMKV